MLPTIALGLVGSFVGGLVSYFLLGYGGGVVFSLLGAILVLYLHRRFVQRRPLSGPGARRLPPS